MGTTNFDTVTANGFNGPLTGDVDGDVDADDVTTVALTVTGASAIDGADVVMANLPTSDPSVAGQLWANSGVLTVSAG